MKNILIIFCALIMLLSLLPSNVLAINEMQYYTSRSIYSEAYKELPKILNENDLAKYYAIYLYQKKRNYKKADEIIAQLENPILLGYVYYLRFTAKNYHPSYMELKLWLDSYSDLAVSSVIYTMAQKIAYRYNQKMTLKKPNRFYDRFVPIYMRHELFKGVIPYINAPKIETPDIVNNKITTQLKAYVKKGKTLNIKNILLKPTVVRKLDSYAYDYYAAILAKLYFLDGNDGQSIFWGQVATKRHPDLLNEAFFTVGLSYYRLKDYDNAVKSLSYFVNNNTNLSSDIGSKGAYWYARAAFAAGDSSAYYTGLKIASKYIYNFYGIIACEELGIKPNYTWRYMKLPKSSISLLADNIYGQRALALLQFGILDWAEQELIFLANYDTISMEKDDETDILNALIYMAQQIPMPALGLKFAGQEGIYYGLSHLSYPIFFVSLQRGYELDPALLLAVMRRESGFYTGAMSGPGATGLMQVLPTTAEYVIKKYKLEEDIDSPAPLTSPITNIEIGQQYVKNLIENADNNLIYTLAGFNAGFAYVSTWKSERHRMPRDPLFFIESIPYHESRNYVKAVTTDYWIYQYKLGLEPYGLYSIVQGGQLLYYPPNKEQIDKIKTFTYMNNH